ncbi:MAG: hypothetical protein WCC64_14695 [Aliidongia sp.]
MKRLIGPPLEYPRTREIDSTVKKLHAALTRLENTAEPRSSKSALKAVRKELSTLMFFTMEWQRYINNAEDWALKQRIGAPDGV